jgi:hypothetical protein
MVLHPPPQVGGEPYIGRSRRYRLRIEVAPSLGFSQWGWAGR